MAATRLKGITGHFGTFLVVGTAATLTHYAAALGSATLVHPLLANIVGYCLGLAVSYTGHHRFTFRVHHAEARHRQRFPRFVLVSGSAVGLSEIILWLCLAHTNWPLWLSQLAAISVVPPFTYVLGRYWVFADDPGWRARMARWMNRTG